MDTQILADYAKILLRTKMYPYFDIANYILMCWTIREDNPNQNTGKQILKDLKFKLYLNF